MREGAGTGWVVGMLGAAFLGVVVPVRVLGQVPVYPPALDTLYPIVGDSVAVRVSGYRILGIRSWHLAVSEVIQAWDEAGLARRADGGCLRTPRPPLPPSRPRPGASATVSPDLAERWARLFEPGEARCPHPPPSAGPMSLRPMAEAFRAELEEYRRGAEAARRSGLFTAAQYWRWIVLYREGLGMYRDYFDQPAPALQYGVGGTWERLPDIPYPVRAPAVATDGARIYVFGGSTNGNVRVARTQILEPGTGSWSQGAALPEAIEWSSAVYADGRFHVLGGVTDRVAAVATHWIYDPQRDAWETGPPMSSPAAGAAAVVIDGRILVAGGNDGPRSYSARLRVYDLESRSWSEGTPAPAARINWQGAAIGGELWVGGGSGPGRTTSRTLHRYIPATGAWSSSASIPTRNEGYAGAEVDGRYCLVGGRVTPASGSFNTPSDRVSCFVPEENRWLNLARLPTAVEEAGAVGLDGVLYVLGGRVSFDGVTGEVHRLSFDRLTR